jgi:hypothetical protein
MNHVISPTDPLSLAISLHKSTSAVEAGDHDRGRSGLKVIPPSTFTGGRAHGHSPQRSTKGLGPHALPQEIKMYGLARTTTPPSLDIHVGDKKMDQVGEFCYLGTIISTDGTCSAAIDDRTRKAWIRLHQSHHSWRLRGLTRKARATFFRCVVLTTLFHGCERWTPSAADMSKLRKNHHNMLATVLHIRPWRRCRVPRAQLRHLMDDISDVDSYLEMRVLGYTGHLEGYVGPLGMTLTVPRRIC